MSVPHQIGGNIVCSSVNHHITKENEQYETIVLCGFDYKLFEGEEGEETREGLDGYPYFNHLTQLWPGYWVKQMAKINEAVGMKNCVTMGGGRKCIARTFRRQEFWKCIVCVLLSVTYGKKRHKVWSELPKYFGEKAPTKLQRYVGGNTNLYKLCCDLYRPFYIYACH